jgi:hypothetical protein
MTGLLRLIRDHPAAVEADLARYSHGSLRDLREGRLTHWEVWARLQYLPLESATGQATGQGDGWSLLTYVAADIYRLLADAPHPADPRTARKAEADRAQAARTKARQDRLNTDRTSVFRRKRKK